MRILKSFFILIPLTLIFIGCGSDKVWYRGNTHAHTVICGHADSPAEVVANWYLDHGYNFLILSEHNHFINPDSVALPENRRKDFILIPGEEVSGPRTVHSTAVNTNKLVSPNKDLKVKSEILQNHVDLTLQAGGQTILNHPNYKYVIEVSDVLPVKHLYMFELFNGHPAVNNFGDNDHISTEVLWDKLLSSGMTLYGVSSDDAHHFSTIDTIYSNPGRGWIMVQTAELTSDAITKAMLNGDFYASNGIILSQCSVKDGVYRIEVDREKTLKELASPDLRGKRVDNNEEGFVTEFIGPNGQVLSVSNSQTAHYSINKSHAYIRVKITLRHRHPQRGMEEFYAWGQPVFTDGRDKDLKR